jgi:Ni/Fe-hydrogenase subunit HybB-like protein
VLALPHLIPQRWERAPVFRPRFALAIAASSFAALALAFLPRAQTITADLSNTNGHVILLGAAVALAVVASISALSWLKRHVVASTVIASVAVVAGMWLERWNIIIPTVTHSRLILWDSYTPTLTEWSLTAASGALFVLMLLVFFKLFPAVSIWEVSEGRVLDQAQAKIEIPLPEPSTSARQEWRVSRRSLP